MTEDELIAIFHARALKRLRTSMDAKHDFAYYTTAATAREILVNGRIWMRLPACMNDFSEVQHGLTMFNDAWTAECGQQLQSALESICPGSTAELEALLATRSLRQLFAETFIACVSEHNTVDVPYGRLSMWRAYGGDAGVALIINGDVFGDNSVQNGAYSSPVEYFSTTQYQDEFTSLALRIERCSSQLRELGPEQLFPWIHQTALLAILCVKHPAFEEEREWRLFSMEPNDRGRLEEAIETVNGIPQPVLKLPLNEVQADGNGVDIRKVLKEIIIGPTQYSIAMREAFVGLLKRAGFADAEQRVRISGVPLRMRP